VAQEPVFVLVAQAVAQAAGVFASPLSYTSIFLF